jgi:hypothetical protein
LPIGNHPFLFQALGKSADRNREREQNKRFLAWFSFRGTTPLFSRFIRFKALLMSEREMAQLIRSDNGSKFITKELQSWLEEMWIWNELLAIRLTMAKWGL